MRHCILASHHRFAAGLADTLEFIAGVHDFDVVCAYVDDADDNDDLDCQVSHLFASYGTDDEVLILTDIMQGSVNQAFLPYMNDHVFLVAGVNVACALELVLSPEPLTVEFIQQTVELARNSMALMNSQTAEVGEEDE